MAGIPWDDVWPRIDTWRNQGATWTHITDTLNAEYGTSVSTSTVRARYGRMPHGPYVIPAQRPSRDHISDNDIQVALMFTNAALGRPGHHPVSVAEYDRVRKQWSPSAPPMPSSIGIIRRFGTWSAACETLGLRTHPPRRHYSGLTYLDVTTWLAHWLRDLRNEPGTPTATIAAYRLWVRDNPDAPSYETIRNVGVWGDLLNLAGEMESTVADLPAVKPVTSGPGKHTPPPLG